MSIVCAYVFICTRALSTSVYIRLCMYMLGRNVGCFTKREKGEGAGGRRVGLSSLLISLRKT